MDAPNATRPSGETACPKTTDARLVAAAEARYWQVATDMSDGLMGQRLPTIDFLDDVIAQLVGVRAVIADDSMPTDERTRCGLRRMLEARRDDAVACLSDDRHALHRPDEDEDVASVQGRIDGYEGEIAFIDAELDRLEAS